MLLGDDVPRQILFGAEMEVQGPLRDSAVLDDLAESGSLEPGLLEHLRRPADDLLSGRRSTRLLNHVHTFPCRTREER